MKHYLNNAGAGELSNITLNAMIDYYQYEQKVGAYQAAKDKKDIIDMFYTNVAKLINADDVGEIAFVDNASRGWNLAIRGIELSKNDVIVTLSTEFGTNLITIYDHAMKSGASVRVIPCTDKGKVDIQLLEKVLSEYRGVKVIAISHAVAHGSIVNPVEQIGVLARKYGALYIVDACQSVGQITVDVKEIDCDVLVASGRKWLCGPRGTGFMYIRNKTNIRPTQLDLASADLILNDDYSVTGVKIRQDAKRFEIWERNIASQIGLATAIDIILNVGLDEISRKIKCFSTEIRNAISKNPKLILIGSEESSSGIVGFITKKSDVEKSILDSFVKNGLTISTMSDWDCPLDFPKNGVKTIFRLSPHYYTNIETIELARKIILSI